MDFVKRLRSILARDNGIAQAEKNAHEAWKEVALDAIRKTAETRQTFIVDDVWPHVKDAETHENRAMGALILKAVKEGWIERTDLFSMSYVSRHHCNPRRVWRSLIYQVQP